MSRNAEKNQLVATELYQYGVRLSEARDVRKSEDCKKVSEAAGFFLYRSAEVLKTADNERKAGNGKKSEKSYAAALFCSELSANAAKNFEAFCKK